MSLMKPLNERGVISMLEFVEVSLAFVRIATKDTISHISLKRIEVNKNLGAVEF